MRVEQVTALTLLVLVATVTGCSRPDTEATSEQSSLPVLRGSELQEFVSTNEKPVLVEFGVDFQCERCRQLKDPMADLADRFTGQAEVVRVDFHSNAALVAQFGGTICPTYVFFRDGQAVKTENFPVSADLLEAQLTEMTSRQSDEP